MAFNLRGSQPIADGSITESKLANNAVTSDKIAAHCTCFGCRFRRGEVEEDD